MNKLLLSPPIAFLIILSTVTIFSAALSKLSLKPTKRGYGEGKSYACGEDVPTHLMQPDYSQFFPFAFFFTVLHVVALMIATVPIETMESFAIAIIYIAGALVGMAILFRR
jgi:hypothetical protein